MMRDKIDNLVEKILGRKINKGILQYFRYLICGGTATVADVSLLFFLTHIFHIYYLFAAALSFVTGIIVNYTLNIILVFQSSGKIKKEFFLFASIGIGGLFWTEIILWILVDKLNIYVMFAKVIAIILVLQWNFFMRKKFVFPEKPTGAENVSFY